VWVVKGVATVTTVDYAAGEMAFTVGGIAGPLGLVPSEFDGEAEVVDTVLVVSEEGLC